MSQALYRKWRPQKWDEVVGQPHIIQTLKNAVSGGHLAHAYLFAGPRGTGKTTAARLLAKAVNCLAPELGERPCNACANCLAVNENRFLDLIEIDAASQTGVDDVRDLRDKINFTPNLGRYKIYIIDEVHMFSNSAFNALLKTLEEPPPHAIFILATTEIHKIPLTVLSRCQRHEFRRLPVEDIVNQLQDIVKMEKYKAEPEALALIARYSAGGMRDAISLLDQLASTGQTIDLELTRRVLGTATSQTVLAMVDAVLARQPGAGMDAMRLALDAGTDARQLARQVVDYLRAILLFQLGNAGQIDLAADVRLKAEKHAAALQSAQVLRMIKVFNAAASDPRRDWHPSLPLELALAELMEPVSSPAPAAVNASPPAALSGKPAPANVKAKPAPAPAKSPKAAAQAGVTLVQVAEAWKQIRTYVKAEAPALEGLLNSSRLISVKDGCLILGFKSDLLCKKTGTEEQLAILRTAIHRAIGADLAVTCVVAQVGQAAPPDVQADGMVAAALKAGGEIVDVQE
jgi:DNA polymerase-3 subunit gamma/tau